MKTNYSIWILCVLTAMLACECRADLSGSDDFNDNSKDTNRWSADFVVNGAGVFTEANQRLEYTTSGSVTLSDIIARPWALNSGSSTQSWEVQIDVSVPPLVLTNQQQVFLGLVVTAGNGFSNRFLIEFGQGSAREFRSFFATNGVNLTNAQAPTITTHAAVRIAYDAGSKVLSSYYDDNGADCGYSWSLIRSEEVGTRWGLSNSSVFNLSVIGDSSLTPLTSGSNVFADEFRTSSGTTPTLDIGFANGSSGKVVLSWPTNAPACHLEFTSTLTTNSICWQIVTAAPGLVGTNFSVTNTISSQQGFYRLSR